MTTSKHLQNENQTNTTELLDNILNSSTEYGIIATDLNDKIVFWNAGAEIIYGYTKDEMVDKQTPQILHVTNPHSNDILLHNDTNYNSRITDYEMKAIRKDGTILPVSVTVTPRFASPGIICGFLIIVKDITNLKVEEKYRDILIEVAHLVNSPISINEMCNGIISAISTILEIPVVFICLLDKRNNNFYVEHQIGLNSEYKKHHCSYTYDDKFVYGNVFDCFLTYSQFTINYGKLTGHAICEFIQDVDLPESDSSIIHIPLLADIALMGILHIVIPSSRKNLLLTETQVLSIIANEISAGIQRKRLEEEIKQYAYDLERLVQERTDQLRVKDAQLVQSGKLATLGEMATGIAHEINQPLGGISLIVQGLQRAKNFGKLNDDILDEKLKSVIEQIDRINKIITHLRTFARQPKEAHQEISVSVPLLDVFKLIGQQLKNKNITIETFISEEIPTVLADHNKLEQVFLNILSNARDALDDFEKKVRRYREASNPPEWVKSWQKKIVISSYEKDKYVYVEIEDTGGGIKKEHINKIFEPFFTTKEVGKGTGLGLSISYGIIKEFGGTISVESEEMLGSRFTIRLPSHDTSPNPVLGRYEH
ncbi:MAG: ATP-binding protein [Bacillota bacterium]|nr:ATP-binding protein [Bacillota bacterium]